MHLLCSSIRTRKSRSESRRESAAEQQPASSRLCRGTQRRRPAPPFLKRYTIADFANTRAYQESTASLISASAEHGPLLPPLTTRLGRNYVTRRAVIILLLLYIAAGVA